jgi:hypothetical protein
VVCFKGQRPEGRFCKCCVPTCCCRDVVKQPHRQSMREPAFKVSCNLEAMRDGCPIRPSPDANHRGRGCGVLKVRSFISNFSGAFDERFCDARESDKTWCIPTGPIPVPYIGGEDTAGGLSPSSESLTSTAENALPVWKRACFSMRAFFGRAFTTKMSIGAACRCKMKTKT